MHGGHCRWPRATVGNPCPRGTSLARGEPKGLCALRAEPYTNRPGAVSSKQALACVRGSSRPHGEFSRGGKNVGEASGKAVHGFSPQNQSICLKLFIPHPAPGRRVSARHAGHCRGGEAPIPVSGRQPQGMPQPPWGAAGSILKRTGSAPWGSKDERWLLQRLP